MRARRSDAARNQVAVLDAARDVLAEYGTEATMELIASRAGVGVGTVYRHFPNKDALVDALVSAIVEHLVASATSALVRADGSGLEEFVRALGQSLAAHRGYAQSLVGHIRDEAGADRLRHLVAQLVTEARRAGQLGPWVTLGDVMAMIWAIRGLVETSGAVAPTAWERYLDVHLHALRSPVSVSTRRSLTADQLARIAAEAN